MHYQSVLIAFLGTSIANSVLASSREKAATSLLAKSRELNDGGAFNAAWMKGYSVHFTGCYKVPSFSTESYTTSTTMATYKLCPTLSGQEDQCGKCESAGEYIASLRDFVTYSNQAVLSAQEYNCEQAQERCEYRCENGYYNDGGQNAAADDDGNNNNNNGNGNDDYCMYQCLIESDQGDCLNQYNGDYVDYDEFIDCVPLEAEQNYRQQSYYVGAHCVDGGVYLGTFTDSQCTTQADKGTYEKYTGEALPSKNLLTGDCFSCREGGNANDGENYNYYGNDGNDEDEVIETCETIYQASGKCEAEMGSSVQHKDNTSCELMNQISWVKKLDRKYLNPETIGKVGYGGLLFFFLTTVVLCCYTGWLSRKVQSELYNQGAYMRDDTDF